MVKSIFGLGKPVGGANASDEKKKRGRPRKVEVKTVKKRGRKPRIKSLVDGYEVAEGKRKATILINEIRKTLNKTEKTLSKVFPEEDGDALNGTLGLLFYLGCALSSLKKAQNDYVMKSGRLYGRSKAKKEDGEN
jgi:hypothetical protein